MQLSLTHTRARWGMQAPLVSVEVHISNGLPGFSLVGLPDASVRESRERVRSALLASGLEFPQRRITVNLAPAELPKDGGRFDLAIAMGILAASGQIDGSVLATHEFLAELSLSGQLRPVSGSLSAALQAGRARRTLVVAPPVADDAARAASGAILAPVSLQALVAHVRREATLPCHPQRQLDSERGSHADLCEVSGQHQAKRALEIAASGRHHLLLIGPPGAGKSMLASRLPGILPALSADEILEVLMMHSLDRQRLAAVAPVRPWRAPHHTASTAALAGGGSNPKPGEISLAHRGVLFLDELPEFPRKTLEVLREPLETGQIHLARAQHRVTFPARIQLVAAMNPCACAHPEKPPEHCSNPARCCQQYQARISGPLLDRIDMHLRVDAVPIAALRQTSGPPPESSAEIRTRVEAAWARQYARAGKLNQELSAAEVSRYCSLPQDAEHLLERAAEKLGFSARAYHRVLKVGRTIADLAQEDSISATAVAEALVYRAGF